MKRTYLSKTSRNRDLKKVLLSGAAVIGVLAALVFTGLFSKTFYAAMTVLTFAGEGTKQTASSFSSLFSSRSVLQKEKDDLQKEVDRLNAMLADRDFLASEVESLNSSSIQARILTKPPFTPFDILLVQIDKSLGISEGDRAMLGASYLGNISFVDGNSARVSLLSSPGRETNVLIGENKLSTTIKGKGGGNMEATLPQGTDIKVGDQVVTSDLNNLYIGKVGHVENNEKNTYISVLVGLAVNMYQISNVEIVSSK